MYLLVCISSLLAFSWFAQANTEIVNFAASQTEYPELIVPWAQLTHHDREISLNVTPILEPSQASSNTGVWLTLDLDEPNWSSFGKFTLRASWSAEYPCDVYLRVLDPHQAGSQFPHLPSGSLLKTRKKYAHIYAVNIGVPAPSPSGEDMTWLRLQPFPITLILEPLHLGVIPHSVVPVIWTLLVAISGILLIMPYVVRYFDNVVAPIREAISQSKRE